MAREEDIERDVRDFQEAARHLDIEFDEDLLREKIRNAHTEAEEHGVTVQEIERRNLMRALFGGGMRP